MANMYEQASAVNMSVKAPLVQTLPFSFTRWEVPKFEFATAMELSGYLQGQQGRYATSATEVTPVCLNSKWPSRSDASAGHCDPSILAAFHYSSLLSSSSSSSSSLSSSSAVASQSMNGFAASRMGATASSCDRSSSYHSVNASSSRTSRS